MMGFEESTSLYRWMNGDDEQPRDVIVKIAITDLIAEWLSHRRNGMDVLATDVLDHIIAGLEKVRKES